MTTAWPTWPEAMASTSPNNSAGPALRGDAGESIVTLARWLGHSSPTVTLDYYAHFMPEAGGKAPAVGAAPV